MGRVLYYPSGLPKLRQANHLNEYHFGVVNRPPILEETLLYHRSPLSPREDERERIMRARKAAEALFASKRPIREPSLPEPLIPTTNQSRKPRVLRALSPASVRHAEGAAQVSAERPTPEIPK